MQLPPADQGKTNVNIQIIQLIAGKGSWNSQTDANKSLLSLVQLHMFRKPTPGSWWWQHSHATPARFLVLYKPCWNLLFILQRRPAQSSRGDPLLCWQGFVCAPPRPLEESGPWCYFGSISQIIMTRTFSGEKLWFCHMLVSEEWQASFQEIPISKLLLSSAILILQINWRALTDIYLFKI